MFRHRPPRDAEPDLELRPLEWVAQLVGWLVVGIVSLLGMSRCVGLYENPHNHNSPLLGYGIAGIVVGAIVFVACKGPARWAEAWRFLLSPAYRRQSREQWRYSPRAEALAHATFAAFSFVVLNLSLCLVLWWLSS